MSNLHITTPTDVPPSEPPKQQRKKRAEMTQEEKAAANRERNELRKKKGAKKIMQSVTGRSEAEVHALWARPASLEASAAAKGEARDDQGGTHTRILELEEKLENQLKKAEEDRIEANKEIAQLKAISADAYARAINAERSLVEALKDVHTLKERLRAFEMMSDSSIIPKTT